MCSIRETERTGMNQERGRAATACGMVLLSLLGWVGGCQRTVPPATRSPVNSTPLVVDEAMQVRDWDRSTNYYANGASVAGGTGYLWQTHEAVKPGHRRIAEAPVALLNIVSMPVGLFVNAPWQEEVIRGESVPPTYTGQPPLPGEPSSNGGTASEVIDTPMPEEESPAPMSPDEPSTPVKEPSPSARTEETPPPPADDVAPVTPAPSQVAPPAPEPGIPDAAPTSPAPPAPVAPVAPVAPGVVEPVPPPPAEPSVAPPAPVAPVVPDATPTQPAVPAPPLAPPPAPAPPGAELNK